MGGFAFVSKNTLAPWHDIVGNIRQHFQRCGFRAPQTIETSSCVIDYYPKLDGRTGNFVLLADGDFAFAVGTFLYQGMIGAAALRAFHGEPDPGVAVARALGHFVLVMRKKNEIYLLRDPLGLQEVMFDKAIGCISSSFLALARAVPGRRAAPQEVYEYVFNGATLGTATVLDGLCKLGVDEYLRLEPGAELRRRPHVFCPPERSGSRADLVDRNLSALFGYARELGAAFGENICQALSGGYDSRLLLAVFRHVGINPLLFVYGANDDQDVRTAKRIATAEGMKLWHVDRSQVTPITPERFPEVLADNFNKADGVPNGGIFDSLIEHIAWGKAESDGMLHVNGGGGEVYRNYFNLLDRPIGTQDIVSSFYRQFDPAVCSADFDVPSYDRAIARKVSVLLDVEDHISRRDVECLYPYFRCRSWFAPENSVNNRYGYSVLPFCDHRIVSEALRIPIRLKHYGNFEAAMVCRADRSLASQVSNYGHSFDRDAPLSATTRTFLFDYLRPMRLRRHSFRIKARLTSADPIPSLLSSTFLDRVLSPGFPYMSKYFKVAKVTSRQQFGRLCTLEYLFQTLSVRESRLRAPLWPAASALVSSE